MWNIYCQNHRSNYSNFLSLAWFDTLDFNRLPCSNNKMYDDAVFADRFRYQLTMFGIRVLIALSRILHDHITHEIYTSKITAAFFRISYFCMIWYAWIHSSAMFKQKNVRCCDFRWSIPLSIDYVWNCSIDRAIKTPSCSYYIWNRYCQNHRSIVLNFRLFEWFDTLEFNR